MNGVLKERLYLAFKYTFLQLSASSVVPLPWPTPLLLKTLFPQGTGPKQTPQRKSPSLSSERGMSYHLAQWVLLGSRMCAEGVMTPWPCYVYDVVVS